MMLETDVRYPIAVKGPASYVDRIEEMFTLQIPNVFKLYHLWWYWLLIIWTLPFQIAYCAVVLVELVLITVLFPIACVPYLRFFSYLAQSICFGANFVLGFLGFIHQDYDDYEPSEKAKLRLKKWDIKKNTNTLLKKTQKLFVAFGLKTAFNNCRDQIRTEIYTIVEKYPSSAHEHANEIVAAAAYYACSVEYAIHFNTGITPTEVQKHEIIALLSQYIDQTTVARIPDNDFELIKLIVVKWCVDNGYLKNSKDE